MTLFNNAPNTPKLQMKSCNEAHPFIDIVEVKEIDERVNFIVKCESQEEADFLKKIWDVKSKSNKISFEELIKTLNYEYQSIID